MCWQGKPVNPSFHWNRWCCCCCDAALDPTHRCCVLLLNTTLLLLQGPVRCLDAAGPWLVSGGQDDQLHIYDVKVRSKVVEAELVLVSACSAYSISVITAEASVFRLRRMLCACAA